MHHTVIHVFQTHHLVVSATDKLPKNLAQSRHTTASGGVVLAFDSDRQNKVTKSCFWIDDAYAAKCVHEDQSQKESNRPRRHGHITTITYTPLSFVMPPVDSRVKNARFGIGTSDVSAPKIAMQ